MKEAILVDLSGVYQGVELVQLDTTGVTPIYATPEPAEPQTDDEITGAAGNAARAAQIENSRLPSRCTMC